MIRELAADLRPYPGECGAPISSRLPPNRPMAINPAYGCPQDRLRRKIVRIWPRRARAISTGRFARKHRRRRAKPPAARSRPKNLSHLMQPMDASRGDFPIAAAWFFFATPELTWDDLAHRRCALLQRTWSPRKILVPENGGPTASDYTGNYATACNSALIASDLQDMAIAD